MSLGDTDTDTDTDTGNVQIRTYAKVEAAMSDRARTTPGDAADPEYCNSF